MTKARGAGLASWIAGAAVAAVWARVLLLGDTFVLRDYLKGWAPLSVFVARSFAEGRVPEWYDGLDLGVSVAGNPNFQLAYPPAWIRVALPGAFACDVLVVLHVASAAAATAVLARRFGAGLAGACMAGGAFALCGCVVSTMSFASVPAAVSWMAWSAVAGDGLANATTGRSRARWGIVLGLVLGLVNLAGEPSFMIGSAVLVMLIALARSARPWTSALVAVGAVALGVTLALVALLPAVLSVRDSERGGGIDYAAATTWSMHPLRLVEAIWPRFLGDHDDDWASLAAIVAQTGSVPDGIGPAWATGHLGAVVVVVAGFGVSGVRRGRALLAVAALFVLLALGRFTPVYAVFRAVVPPEHFVRYPHKHLPEALVLLCALAGVGHGRVFEGAPRRRCMVACAGVAVALGLGLIATLCAPAAWLVDAAARTTTPIDVGAALAHARSGAVLALGSVVAFAACTALAPGVPRVRGLRATAAAIALLPSLVDAWTLQPTAPRAALHTAPAVLAPAIESERSCRGLRPRLYRMLGLSRAAVSPDPRLTALALHDSAHPNLATELGLAYVPGYESTHSSAFWSFWNYASARADGQRVLSALDVRWMLWPDALGALPSSFHPRAHTDRAAGFTLAEVTPNRPRAFATTKVRWVPDIEAAFEAAIRPDRDAAEAILVGPAREARGPGPVAAAPCDVYATRPEDVVLDCSLPAPGYAVLLDAWAPGWKAWVDGTPSPVEKMDGIARAVAMPAGRHQVEMRFRAPGLRLGAALSLAAAIACAMAGWWLRSRQPPT